MTGLLTVVAVVALTVSGVMAARQIHRVDGPALKAWFARAVAEYRAERDQPNAGLSVTGCRSRSPLPRRKTFDQHAAEALAVTSDDEHDQILASVREIQQSTPESLAARFFEETTR